MTKIAVVLFNLGGPDSLDSVRPFLRNLFGDRAIIGLPALIRLPLAWYIAKTRNPISSEMYERIGGKSPIVEETRAQANALEAALKSHGHDAKCFIAMRYWHPFTDGAVAAVKAWKPEQIVLLPLYPQFSTTTTRSSLQEWQRAARKAKLTIPAHGVCCYPDEPGFVTALSNRVKDALAKTKPGVSYRILFSAHGLPKRTVVKGDPYPSHMEKTVHAVAEKILSPQNFTDWLVCYQSRVGRLEWIGPETEAEVHRAGVDGKGLIVVPVAFVSEHSETLFELDLQYGELATKLKLPDYIRAPTVRVDGDFIEGLAKMTLKALGTNALVNCDAGRICAAGKICMHGEMINA